MKELGKVQRSVLEAMVRHENMWHPACGWYWDSLSRTKQIMQALEKKGCVYSYKNNNRNTGYRVTPLGKDLLSKEN